MTRAYYNEFDPYAAQWLRNLISAGLIAPGDVDDRSMMGIDSRTEATSRAADGGYSAANHFNAHALGCEQAAAAIRALAEEAPK